MTAPSRIRPAARQRLAYLVDPRFSGGTSAAFAQELAAAVPNADVAVHCVESPMFRGQEVAPALFEALRATALRPDWDARVIAADVVVIHNPLFLKQMADLGRQIVARHLIVVTHENVIRPGGADAFDLGHCLQLVQRASLARRRSLAPVSAHNRATVTAWLSRAPGQRWDVLEEDWFNICDMGRVAPTTAPRDRRGRHSRPGLEKFPDLASLDRCFPAIAERNIILGADQIGRCVPPRPHWTLMPFNAIPVDDYFGMIDFMVYFTAPTWRESFGRSVAEAMAAGKVVIGDATLTGTFGAGVIAASAGEVDDVVRRFIEEPRLYAAQVRAAQEVLGRFSGARFGRMLQAVLDASTGVAA